MRDDYQSLLNVEAAFLDGTKPGGTFAEAFKKGEIAYALHGFDKDEWTKHHQGGPTGYAPREWPANRSSAQLIFENQPIAWNPTGNGWKAEDTILATSKGIEILSIDPDWPTLNIDGRLRPDILRK